MRKGIAFLLWMTVCLPLQAIGLRGIVRSADGAGMPFVTISVLAADSSLLAGTITKDDGSFAVDAPAGASVLRASYMGYATAVYEWNSVPACITLREETTALSELTVEGNASLVERRMDKIVLNVSNSPFAIGSSGKDILRKAPGVNIDRKGKVTVNGKAVEVYVDGRPTYLSGEQLKTMLESTDGSTIDRIEVITQPSARYDAAGQGGIINIRTKRNKSKGVNGSLTGSYGGMLWRDIRQYMQDEQFSLNLNYRSEKTYTSASLTQTYDDKIETYEMRTTTPEQERTTRSQMRNRNPYIMLKLGNDWYVDSLNTVGLNLSVPLSYGRGYGDPACNGSALTQGGTVVEQTAEERTTRDRWTQHTANLHYTHIFDKALERELSVQADYNRSNQASQAHYTMSQAGNTDEIGQMQQRVSDIGNLKLNFETSFWRTGKLECGAKWQTNRTACATNDDSFAYTEHIGAAYFTAGKAFGEHWTTKLGLRGEYTLSRGQWQASDSATSQEYFHLFPTAFVSYMPAPDWSVSLNYTRRIQRPASEMLDPTSRQEDVHSIRVGDPTLRPALTHNVIASFGYSQYVSLDFNFAHTTDWTDYKSTILPDGSSHYQATNYGTNTSHGIFLSLTELPIVPRLSRDAEGHRELTGAWLALSAFVGGNRESYRSYDGQIDSRHWSVDVYAELSAYLPKNWTLSLDGFYATPGMWGAEEFSSWKELNLALKKDLPEHGLTLTARVNDLMLSSDWSSRSVGLPEGYSNTLQGSDRAHMLTLGITWKFGTTLDNRQDDLSDETEFAAPAPRGRHGRH